MIGRAVVTGAASGIGAATARAFASQGIDVLGVDRLKSPDCAQSLIVDLAKDGGVDEVISRLDGSYTVLVNAAGAPSTHAAASIVKINVLAPRQLTSRFLERAQPGASVVHVSSGAGWIWRRDLETLLPLLALADDELAKAFCARVDDGVAAYEVSKALITLHAVSRAAEAWRKGARLNAVAPGGVETPMLGEFRRSMGAATLDWSAKAVGRHALPEEIADVIVFLASPAARWINGVELMADGGLAAGAITGAWEPFTA